MSVLPPVARLLSIPTRRSLLPPPKDRTSPRWQASWAHLCEGYAPAMRQYVSGMLRRMLGRAPDPDEVDDVVGAYLAECMEKGWLAEEAVAIRSFRGYLEKQLRRFTLDHLDKKFRQRRDPRRAASGDALAAVASTKGDPVVALLDRGWVDAAVERALALLRVANPDYAEVVQDLLRTGGEGSPDVLDRLARRPTNPTMHRRHARERFAALFVEELRATVRDDASFRTLLRRLRPYLP